MPRELERLIKSDCLSDLMVDVMEELEKEQRAWDEDYGTPEEKERCKMFSRQLLSSIGGTYDEIITR